MSTIIPLPKPSNTRSKGKRALTIATIVGLAALIVSSLYVLFVEAPPPKRITIASGSKSGAYYRAAQRYASELKKQGITVEVRETAGSVENLQLLNDDGSGVSVAIVQSGAMAPEDSESLDVLGSLYREPLWVFYRGGKDSPTLNRPSQLAGKHIGVGPTGSGTKVIATQLLEVNGLPGPGDRKGAPTILAPNKWQ